MLKELIKRDGAIEARDDRKLNGWGEWGSNHLGERIDWSPAALAAVGKMPERATTRELMVALIDELLTINTYPSHLMAGRLYANVIRKDLYGSAVPPTVFNVQGNLIASGMMADMGYSMAEYAQIEGFINHELDYFCPEYSLRWITEKYAIRNYITGQVFETPQFVYMRMAMELARSGDVEGRVQRVRRFYNVLSGKKLSAPTPNYLYLGTKHRGFASCCIYTAADTVESLAIGNHIAFMMTANSAGLGSFINTRTVGDPIDGGRVKHGGKFRYLKCTATDTIANKQAARSGAGTTSVMCFDPEVIDVLQYRNPMMPDDKQNRDLHYSLLYNRFFARKVANNEDIFTFTQFSAPDLFEAFFLGQPDLFAEIYAKYEADVTFVKQYVSARKIVKFMFAEAFNTGTSYNANIDEIAIHTPFKIEPGHVIHCANLCQEICEIQSPYMNMMDLYSSEDHGRGEIAMCNLAAIPVDNIENDAEYEEVCYLALKMIDHTILNGEYPFPHLAFTAKQRMNAGVGMMGVATHMARKGLRWDTPEGKAEIHFLAERHMYFLIKASLKIAKERDNAPWIHKTKWPQGWLPLDTYNKNVDKIGNFTYLYNWEELRAQIIEQGGIAHSVLNAGMPGESSSKALGSSNAFYPVRSRTLSKTDGSGIVLRWAAKDEDLLGDNYQSAYDIPTRDLIDNYAIFQKFSDQSLSCDYYKRFTDADMQVSDDEIFETFLYQTSRGPKNRYYTNNLRPKKNKNIEDMMKPQAALTAVGDQPHVSAEAPVFATPLSYGALPLEVHDAGFIPHVAPGEEHAGELPRETAAPVAILDLGLLGSLTGVEATPAMAARAAQFEEVENDNKCEGMCSL